MNKNEYVELHRLLAKLKFELSISICETSDNKLIKEYRDDIEAIDKIMQVFIIDNN